MKQKVKLGRPYLRVTCGFKYLKAKSKLELRICCTRCCLPEAGCPPFPRNPPPLFAQDAANAKSNQKNLGTIKSSNLCTEIIEYVSPKHDLLEAACRSNYFAADTAVQTRLPCATSPPSISRSSSRAVRCCLPRRLPAICYSFWCRQAPGSRPYFDFERLVNRRAMTEMQRSSLAVQVHVTRVITRNLNAVIDVNYYPVLRFQPSCCSLFIPVPRCLLHNAATCDTGQWALECKVLLTCSVV
jgi:hypothetical protein